MTDETGEPPVGNVGEEAVKLLQALSEWAKESGSDYATSGAAATAGMAGIVHEVNEHIATGSESCRYCPVCQLVSAVRGTSPEVKEHLTSAAGSLVQAAAGLLATPVPDQTSKRRPEPPVEKIDLDAEPGDNLDWEDD